MTDSEDVASLRRQIEASGGPDRYIDEREEADIYEQGGALGLDRKTVEALLNQMCRDGGWTRERDIVADLRDQLNETTSDDGAIDQKEFEHCVNYAVAMNMPRKRATELSVRYVLDKRIRVKKAWLVRDWFAPLRDQYGG